MTLQQTLPVEGETLNSLLFAGLEFKETLGRWPGGRPALKEVKMDTVHDILRRLYPQVTAQERLLLWLWYAFTTPYTN
jgi:hypothetical protein